MNAYEDPIPTDPIWAKTVVFELICPEAFAAYRDCSWRIISILALPTSGISVSEPRLLLANYSQLRRYIKLK